MKVAWSCPVPHGAKSGGPFSVLNQIHSGLEEQYKDNLTIISGEGMPYEAAKTLAGGSLFDELASFELPLDCDLFVGVGYDSLLQIRELKDKGRIRLHEDTRLGLRIPKVVTVHMSTHHENAYRVLKDEYLKWGIKEEPLPPLLRWRGHKEHELVDGIIVASQQQKETYEAGNPRLKDKIHVVPWGVDGSIFSPHDGTPVDGLRLLYAGGNAPRKGVGYLLTAWNNAKLKGMLTLLGTNIRASIWRTQILGWVKDEDVPGIYKMHSVYVLPSLEVGSACTVYEAMSTGLPCIITRECGIDFFKDNVHGLIVPARDTKALQDAIQYFSDNPDEIVRMGKNARETVSGYTWARFRENLIKELEAI